MTRDILQKIGGARRFAFQGTFERYGFKYADHQKRHAKPTILLVDINIIDEQVTQVTDHLWFNLTQGFEALGILQPGDQLHFEGRIAEYLKGYQCSTNQDNTGLTVDWHINRPSKVKLSRPIDTKSRSIWPQENWRKCQLIYDLYQSDYQKRGIFKPYLKSL